MQQKCVISADGTNSGRTEFGTLFGNALGLLLSSTFLVLTTVWIGLGILVIYPLGDWYGQKLVREKRIPNVNISRKVFILALVFVLPICWFAPIVLRSTQMKLFVKKEVPIYQIAKGEVKFESDVLGYNDNSIEIRFYAKENYSYQDIVNFYRNNFISKGWEVLPVRHYDEQTEYFNFRKKRRVAVLNIQKWDNKNYVEISVLFPNLIFHPDKD